MKIKTYYTLGSKEEVNCGHGCNLTEYQIRQIDAYSKNADLDDMPLLFDTIEDAAEYRDFNSMLTDRIIIPLRFNLKN